MLFCLKYFIDNVKICHIGSDDMEKNENLDICRECGGRCCKKSGCDYSAKDFSDLSFKALCEILSEGKISVVTFLKFKKMSNGRTLAEPFLYLRARNQNRDIIDLVSMKTRCSQLGEDGCNYPYEKRPAGGVNLTPVRRKDGYCYPKEDPFTIAETWRPYQNALRKIVKRYTGMSVENKIRQDVEMLFEDIYAEKFDGVSRDEKEDLLNFVATLGEAYPDELSKARKKGTVSVMFYNKK